MVDDDLHRLEPGRHGQVGCHVVVNTRVTWLCQVFSGGGFKLILDNFCDKFNYSYRQDESSSCQYESNRISTSG